MNDVRRDGIEEPSVRSTEAADEQSDTIPLSFERDMRSEYLKLLEIHNLNRIDYNTRKWETLKYFQSIVLALLGGTVIALTAGLDKGIFCKPLILSLAFTIVVSGLPLVAAVAAWLGISNLSRESALLFAEEAQIFKFAKLLHLDLHVPQVDRWIPGDDRLLMPKWRDWTYGVGDARPDIDFPNWIKQRTAGHKFKNLSNVLFGFECAFGVAIATIVVALFANSRFVSLTTLLGESFCRIGSIDF